MMILAKYMYSVLLLTLFLFCLSCVQGRYLRTRLESTIDNRSTYTILFYDEGYPKQIIILDIEGDEYTFTLPASMTDPVVHNSVPADKVLAEGLQLIGNARTVMREILDNEGSVIGYELRPMHSMFRYGASDILNVDYVLQDRKVAVKAEIKPSVRNIYFREFYGGG